MKNFALRTFTGFLFTIVTVLAVIWHESLFLLFFGSVMILILIEYYRILRKVHGRPQIAWIIILSVLLYISGFLLFNKIIPASALAIIVPMFFLVFITELYRRKRRFAHNLAMTFLPVIHVSLPLVLFTGLAYIKGFYQFQPILGIIIFVWAYDTFAYITGVLIGKNKIAPKISPKKSWEGLVGGAVAAAGAAIIVGHYWTIFTPVTWIVISFIISITSTLGDLIESVLKRTAGIKDSGHILPGHGGVFDRFDGFLFAIPFVFGYLYILN